MNLLHSILRLKNLCIQMRDDQYWKEYHIECGDDGTFSFPAGIPVNVCSSSKQHGYCIGQRVSFAPNVAVLVHPGPLGEWVVATIAEDGSWAFIGPEPVEILEKCGIPVFQGGCWEPA